MRSIIDKTTSVGDFVVRYPQLRQTLEELGIDYCCGGKKTMAAAAKTSTLAWPAVETALEKALAQHPEPETTDWNRESLSALVDHIVDMHHTFMKVQLPRLDGLLAKVERAHSAQHGQMLAQLRRAYDAIRSELEAHLMKEEQILFPLIQQTEAFVNGGGPRPVSHCGSVANPIRQMEVEHDDAGDELAVMRKVTDGYRLPPDACPTFASLYEGLAAMEADLHEHIHLENNILFPRSVKLEAEMQRHANGSPAASF